MRHGKGIKISSVTRIRNSVETHLQSTVSGSDSMSSVPNEISPLTHNESESSDFSAIVQSMGQVPTASEQHRSMNSTNEMWNRRGGGINCPRPMSNISVPESALQFATPDYLTGPAYGTGLAEEYEAAASMLGRTSGSTGLVGTSDLSSGASASSIATGTGVHVGISVATVFHESPWTEKWEPEPVHDDPDNVGSNFIILPEVCPGTGSEAATRSEILPKMLEIGSSTLENVCNFHGQGNSALLDALRDDCTFTRSDVSFLYLTDRILNQHRPHHNPEPESAIHTINNPGAESTPNHIHHGEISELVFSEEPVPANSTYPAYQFLVEDEIMIYNHHAQQWQDELTIFNSHEANAERDLDHLGPMSGICDVAPTLQEQPQLEVGDGVHCNTLSSVDTDDFSFWPAKLSFDYSLEGHPSPSLWPGGGSAEQQPPSSCYLNEASTSYTWQNVDSSVITPAVDNMKPETGPDGKQREVEAEVCASAQKWLDSRGDPIYSSMSQRDNAVDARDKHIAGSSVEAHVDKSSHCPGISAEQETTEMQQRIFPDSLDLLQGDNNQFPNAAVSAWLQEHASELLQCSKRDRTNSIEMLSRPTSSLRKKKQKDQEIPEGRLRGTSICTDPDLSYGLAAVQNVLKGFHKSAGLILKAKLQEQRPPVTDFLDSELEALCIEDSLGQQVKVAVLAVLKHGRGNQQATTTDSFLVEQILDLKWRLASLLEEMRTHERSSLSQLRDTVTRYSFLFPSSASDALTKRETPGKHYEDLEKLVCQFFGDSKLFLKPPYPSASSSSGRQGHEHSSGDTGSLRSVHPTIRGRVAVESLALGEPNAGTISIVERSERTRITSRKELSGARGNLPKVAAEYMKQWLFENFQNPNPTRETKLFIATKFSITEKQVTNHFVNLRARKFRPLLRSLQEDPRSEVVDNMQGPNDEDIGSSESPESPGAAKGACCH